jgi:hypothetical protein
MAIKKKPFKNFNGTSWDEIYFETSEDQIKDGWIQGKPSNGENYCYRKLPGGLILQWGSFGLSSTSSGIIDVIHTLPISYTQSSAFYASSYLSLTSYWEEFGTKIHTSMASLGQLRFVLGGGANPSQGYDLRYFCIGF